jgi:hypothetical protein
LDILKCPYIGVLTRSAVRKYFGNEDPLGKTLTVDGSMRAYAGPITFWLDRRSNFFTNILLAQEASAVALEQKLPDFMEKYSGDLRHRMWTLNTLMPTLQHLPDIHLTSHFEREWESNGDFSSQI